MKSNKKRNTKPQKFLLILILITVTLSCTDQPSCFINKIFNFQFPTEGIYPISIQQNQSSFSVKAYGDFNDDLASDFIAINGNNQIVLYLWNKQTLFFDMLSPPNNISTGCQVQSIYLYDVNNDGYLDFTIWGQYSGTTNYCLIPFYQNVNNQGQNISFQEQNGVNISSSLPPIYITHRTPQFNGFLVFNQTRILLRYDIINKQYNQVLWQQLFSNKLYENIAFSDPHWNSFLDITGDCLVDVIICNQNNQFQFWINQGATFNLSLTLPFSNLTSLSFSDLNYDGGIDMVIFSQNGIITSYLNNHPPSSSKDFCNPKLNSLPFDFTQSNTFILPNNFQIPQQMVNFGDVNIDGYPDLQLQLYNSTSTNQMPYILLNDPKKFISFTFPEYINDVFINNLKDLEVVSSSLFDILQNGILDSFVLIKNSQNVFQMKAFYNNYLYQNSFFLKGYAAIGPQTQHGSFITGANFFWINSVDGFTKISNQIQCIQTAYNALQLPYVLGGLGRANNYVQSFTIANQGYSHSWSPIIPNSQLAIYTLPTTQNDWAITIYVLPTQSLIYVIIISVIILVVLGSILVVMKYRQYKRRPKIDDLIG